MIRINLCHWWWSVTMLNQTSAKIEFFRGVLLQMLVVELVAGESMFVNWNYIILNAFLFLMHQFIFPNWILRWTTILVLLLYLMLLLNCPAIIVNLGILVLNLLVILAFNCFQLGLSIRALHLLTFVLNHFLWSKLLLVALLLLLVLIRRHFPKYLFNLILKNNKNDNYNI
jgi:hypothetical protein